MSVLYIQNNTLMCHIFAIEMDFNDETQVNSCD